MGSTVILRGLQRRITFSFALSASSRETSWVIKHVASFQELLSTPFANGVNAICWPRSLAGDFAGVTQRLGSGDGIVALDEERLMSLEHGARSREAVKHMLSDLKLLREAGRDPVLNIVHGYPRDDSGDPIATDVFSWHVDSAPIESDTWLCTYHGAPSEGLLTEHAVRKVDDPVIRPRLWELYRQGHGGAPQPPTAGAQLADFEAWLADNHYDLHYSPRSGATPYSFGLHNLWRIACAWPGSQVPPCVHRAPATDSARLLLIS